MDVIEYGLLGGVLVSAVGLAIANLVPWPGGLFVEVHDAASPTLEFMASLFLVVIAMVVAYAHTRAFREEEREFDRRLGLFVRASRVLDDLERAAATPGHEPKFRHVIEQLGREALRENAEWLLLHRERPLTEQLN